eukprot:1149653-Pelagomonas_calceolata.AAC.11
MSPKVRPSPRPRAWAVFIKAVDSNTARVNEVARAWWRFGTLGLRVVKQALKLQVTISRRSPVKTTDCCSLVRPRGHGLRAWARGSERTGSGHGLCVGEAATGRPHATIAAVAGAGRERCSHGFHPLAPTS